MNVPNISRRDWERHRVGWACFRIEQLFQSIAAYEISAQHPLFFSAITEILIHLRDLCYMAAQPPANVTLTWSDDIKPCASYSNITDLIIFFRDGFCHSTASHSALTPGNKYSIFKSVQPKAPYQDDIAIILGSNRIFLFRHMGRAFEELRTGFVDAGIVGSPYWTKLQRPPEPSAPFNTKE